MESYDNDLNKHFFSQEQQEKAYLAFEDEVYDDVKTLNELAYYIENYKINMNQI